jgi:phospholipase/carboxylesterase
MVHGEDDPVIAIELAERSVQQLKDSGYDVEWRTYPMEHSVSMEEIGHIGAWLRRILPA